MESGESETLVRGDRVLVEGIRGTFQEHSRYPACLVVRLDGRTLSHHPHESHVERMPVLDLIAEKLNDPTSES